MKGRFSKCVRAVLCAGLICMAATPAWAGVYVQCFSAYLDGVDRCGNLTPCGGTCAPFIAIVNTCNGTFVGTAQGCVANCSHCLQVYCNGFGYICGLCVCSSVYVVDPCGNAFLFAQGKLCCGGGGPA